MEILLVFIMSVPVILSHSVATIRKTIHENEHEAIKTRVKSQSEQSENTRNSSSTCQACEKQHHTGKGTKSQQAAIRRKCTTMGSTGFSKKVHDQGIERIWHDRCAEALAQPAPPRPTRDHPTSLCGGLSRGQGSLCSRLSVSSQLPRKRRAAKSKRLRRSHPWWVEPAGSRPRGGGLGFRLGYGTEPPKPYLYVCLMRCYLPYTHAHSNLLSPCVHVQGAAGLVAHLLCGQRLVPRASPSRYVDLFCTRQLGRQLFVGAWFEGTARGIRKNVCDPRRVLKDTRFVRRI